MKKILDWYLVKWIFIGAFVGVSVSQAIYISTDKDIDVTLLGIILGVYIRYQLRKVKNK